MRGAHLVIQADGIKRVVSESALFFRSMLEKLKEESKSRKSRKSMFSLKHILKAPITAQESNDAAAAPYWWCPGSTSSYPPHRCWRVPLN